jgi:hypothetical protein
MLLQLLRRAPVPEREAQELLQFMAAVPVAKVAMRGGTASAEEVA